MNRDSLRAILFDFDGVLADSEPVHLRLFQKVLAEEGILLTREAYYQKYLGLDDRGCFAQVFRDFDRPVDAAKIESIVHRKNLAMLEHLRTNSVLMPGAVELIQKLKGRYFLAIVSGALKSEILSILQGGGLVQDFQVIVAADDVAQGKPHPEGFQSAIRLLNRDFIPPAEILLPGECLAIEDSPWGIQAAKAAGAFCLGVTTSYDSPHLHQADLIAKDTASIDWSQVDALFS